MSNAIYDGEWVIAMNASGKYLGKMLTVDSNDPDYPRGLRLGPVYDIKQISMTHNGQPALDVQLMPFLLIADDIELTLRGDIAVIKLSALGEGERARWHEMIRGVQRGMPQLKAQRAGIKLAPMPRPKA